MSDSDKRLHNYSCFVTSIGAALHVSELWMELEPADLIVLIFNGVFEFKLHCFGNAGYFLTKTSPWSSLKALD